MTYNTYLYSQMHKIFMFNTTCNLLRLFCAPINRIILVMAQQPTLYILSHVNFIWCIYNTVSTQYFSKIFRLINKSAIFRQTKGQRIILIWKLCMYTCHFDCFHFYSLAFLKLHWCHTRNIKPITKTDRTA